jgi:microcystin-dependent protein
MKLPTLDSVKKVNIKDTKTITILIIIVIVLFAIIYVWQNKTNVEEGFAQYNVNDGDLVVLPNLDSVIVDTIGNQKNQKLPDALNMLIDDRFSTSSALNTYAKASDLNNTNINLASNASSLLSTISSMNALSTRLTNDLSIMNSIITSNVNLINNNLTSNVALMTGLVNNAPPALTVVAYFGSTSPTGWQLCDGLPLIAMDGQNVFYNIGSSFNPLKTPNLLGRFILGATTNINANSLIPSSIILRNDVGATGGEENVKLDIKEIPAHSHRISDLDRTGNPDGWRDGNRHYWRNASYQGLSDMGKLTDNTGGDSTMTQIQDTNFPTDTTKKMNDTKPHNNMPPYYSLIYIIKKPLRGGNANAVQQPSPLITN